MRLTLLTLYIFIISLIFGQLFTLPVPGGAGFVYLSDLILPVLLFFWVLESFHTQKSLILPWFFLLQLAFGMASLFSLFLATSKLDFPEFIISFSYWLRWVVYALTLPLVYDLTKKIPEVSERITSMLIVSGVALAFFGFIQLAVFPDFTAFAISAGWDPHRGRLLSTFFDPNFTGAFLSLTFALGFTKIGKVSFRLLFPIMLILALAILLTFSRSSWMLLGIIILVFGFFKKPSLILVSIALGLSAYLIVPRIQTRIAGITDPADSAHFRILSWKNTLEIVSENIFTGIGFNAFRYAQVEFGFFSWQDPLGGHAGAGSDSSLLLVLATTGVVGLFLYICIFGYLLYHAYGLRERLLPLLFFASILGLLVESNFINSLFFPPIMIWIWLVGGLILSEVPLKISRFDS